MASMKIDDTIKEYFRQGVKLFYDTGETRTLKETFERTVVHFFHQGWEWHNGMMVPILPPAEELPTLAQFRYWYGKEQGFVKKITSREGKQRFDIKHRPLLGNSMSHVFGPGSEYQFDVREMFIS